MIQLMRCFLFFYCCPLGKYKIAFPKHCRAYQKPHYKRKYKTVFSQKRAFLIKFGHANVHNKKCRLYFRHFFRCYFLGTKTQVLPLTIFAMPPISRAAFVRSLTEAQVWLIPFGKFNVYIIFLFKLNFILRLQKYTNPATQRRSK